MKKGFTLVELLGVITLLGLILAISIPVISSILDKNEEEYYDNLESMVETVAKTYLSDHYDHLPKTDGASIEVSFLDSAFLSYFKKIPTDVKGEHCDGHVTVTRIKKNDYTYKACITCGEYESPVC